MRKLTRILGVLLIFVFGVFVGGAIAGAGIGQKLRDMLLGGPEAMIDVVVKRLDHELKLDPEQKRKLESIVDDARIKLRQSRARIQPEVEQTLLQAEERTRAILYPNQTKKFDDLIRRSHEKWKETEGVGTKLVAPTPATSSSTPHPDTP